mmetsp:Transcript_21026/g.18650  ORF Transcript_21026/g.18650 Transcript_21026/m.18650 type:complete len:113 (+) Transcript_21026:179-517(+)
MYRELPKSLDGVSDNLNKNKARKFWLKLVEYHKNQDAEELGQPSKKLRNKTVLERNSFNPKVRDPKLTAVLNISKGARRRHFRNRNTIGGAQTEFKLKPIEYGKFKEATVKE